jgi:hypothetical protein
MASPLRGLLIMSPLSATDRGMSRFPLIEIVARDSSRGRSLSGDAMSCTDMSHTDPMR